MEKELVQASEPEKNSNEKKHVNVGKIILAVFIGFMVVLAAVYGGITFSYRDRFLPETTVNGISCSNMNPDEVVAQFISHLENYELQVLGRNLSNPVEGETEVLAVLRADEIGLDWGDIRVNVEQVLRQQNPWKWPLISWLGGDEYTVKQKVTWDEKMLQIRLEQESAFRPSNMVQPKNAYLSEFDEQAGGFVIVPETAGSQLNKKKTLEVIQEAIGREAEQVDLEENGCYLPADVTTESKKLVNAAKQANTWIQTRITYDWNENTVILDGEQLRQWITIQNSKPVLDEEAVASFVKKNSAEYDTYGKYRNFMTTKGVELTLPGGAYGWKTDRDAETKELISLIKEGTQGEREPVYSSKGRWRGANDIGNSYVEIDLTFQHLYLYQKGEIVLETDFVSGNMSNGNMTPPGVFGLTYKTTNAVLRGRDYTTPVNYWMPFNGNVGMHDATWRGSFGGTIYLTSGSHGCINLPLSKAAEIYEYMSEGFPIICYYYPEGVELPGIEATKIPLDEIPYQPDESVPLEESGSEEE